MELVPVAGNRLFVLATLARKEGGTANICPLTLSALEVEGTEQGGER
jgi:hypothetical protein